MSGPDPADLPEKKARISRLLARERCDALVIGRRDNFSWLTGGGDNGVVRSSENGFGILVVTGEKTYLVAQTMDGPRIMDEELAGMDVEPVFLRWYEESREEKAASLVTPGRALCDIPVPGAKLAPKEITALHYPLTEREIERCRTLAGETEAIIAKVAHAIEPGMRETEIEAMLSSQCAAAGAPCGQR